MRWLISKLVLSTVSVSIFQEYIIFSQKKKKNKYKIKFESNEAIILYSEVILSDIS